MGSISRINKMMKKQCILMVVRNTKEKAICQIKRMEIVCQTILI
jgi:hypothetical protein